MSANTRQMYDPKTGAESVLFQKGGLLGQRMWGRAVVVEGGVLMFFPFPDQASAEKALVNAKVP